MNPVSYTHLDVYKRQLQGKGLLCGMYLQKSMAEAFYVEYDFFFGDFSNVKKYPTTYDSDVYRRIGVLTKEDKTLTGLIDYELYTPCLLYTSRCV